MKNLYISLGQEALAEMCFNSLQCHLKSSFHKHEASFPDIQPNHIEFDHRELIQLVFIDLNICLCFLLSSVLQECFLFKIGKNYLTIS